MDEQTDQHAKLFESLLYLKVTLFVIRCEVTDMGETVAKDLDEPVLVSRPPDLAVLPAAIVLPQVGNRIDANIQESTIFCFIKE